ncbi:titin [Forsythia ovata]|uniref:Titin n=1 Tax=Forsythia ovata TaxID=205694 RepID=A0ABD1QNI1_9LAMI
MASETVVSDHSTASEQLEKEEGKTMEQDKVPPPKETMENPKTEESLCPAAPLAETEAKLEEKQIEPPAKAEDLPEEQKIKDNPVELPPTEEIKKIEDTPIVETSAEDNLEVAKNTVPEPDAPNISESMPETVKCQSEEKSETGRDEKPEVESNLESVEEKPKEVPKIVDVAEPTSVEAVDLAESEMTEDKPVEQPPTEEIKKIEDTPLVEAPVKDDSEVAKDTVPEPDTANISESTPSDVKCQSEEKLETENAEKTEVESIVEFIEEKPKETPKIVDVPESTPEEQVEVSKAESKGEEISKPALSVEEKPAEQFEVTEQTDKEPPAGEPAEKVEVETPTDKAEEVMLSKEECSDEVKLDVPVTQVETKEVEISPTEKTGVENEEKESVKETNVPEGISKEKVEPGKIEVEAKTEDENEEKCVVAEELAKPETKEVEDSTSSITKPEVTSKDVEPIAENGSKKDETIASTETCKDALLEGKVDEEETKEAEKVEEKPKLEENVQDTEASQDAPKQDVPVKTTQKQSNNIIKIVKQSLVKAKKAITGKSTSSKTPAIETKDDGKGK